MSPYRGVLEVRFGYDSMYTYAALAGRRTDQFLVLAVCAQAGTAGTFTPEDVAAPCPDRQ